MEDDPDLFYDNLDTEIALLTAAADNPSITVIDPMGRALVPKKIAAVFPAARQLATAATARWAGWWCA
jgi:hypothetical protein